MFIFNPFHIDLGIDLGTANTIVYAKKEVLYAMKLHILQSVKIIQQLELVIMPKK